MSGLAGLAFGLFGLGFMAAVGPSLAPPDPLAVIGGGCYVNTDAACPFDPAERLCDEVACTRVAEFDFCPGDATQIKRLDSYPSTRPAAPGEWGNDQVRSIGQRNCVVSYECAMAGSGGSPSCTDPDPDGVCYCKGDAGGFAGSLDWREATRQAGDPCLGLGVPTS